MPDDAEVMRHEDVGEIELVLKVLRIIACDGRSERS